MKRILPWLLIGVIILVIIPITLHPDIRGFALGAQLISSGHILDFYDYLSRLPSDSPLVRLYGRDLFIYPPLANSYPAVYMKLLWPFYPQELLHTLIIDMGKVIGQPQLSLLLYLLKLPNLVVDFLIVYLLGKFFEKRADKSLGQILWLINPVTIYSAYMLTQSDILLALSIMVCLLFAKKGKYCQAAFALAMGALVKQFVLFLLPILALYAPGSFIKKLGIFLVGIMSYALVLVPYLSSPGFRHYALLASQADKIFFAKIPVSGGAFLPIFLVGMFLLYWFCWLYARKYELWQWFMWPLLLFYSVVHFHPQWFTWITPILVIFLVRLQKKAILPTLAMLWAFLGIILMFEPSLNVGLFAPLNPPWSNDYSLLPLLTKLLPEVTLRSVFFAFLASAAGVVSYLSFKRTVNAN